jgi:hypothetical protein
MLNSTAFFLDTSGLFWMMKMVLVFSVVVVSFSFSTSSSSNLSLATNSSILFSAVLRVVRTALPAF